MKYLLVVLFGVRTSCNCSKCKNKIYFRSMYIESDRKFHRRGIEKIVKHQIDQSNTIAQIEYYRPKNKIILPDFSYKHRIDGTNYTVQMID